MILFGSHLLAPVVTIAAFCLTNVAAAQPGSDFEHVASIVSSYESVINAIKTLEGDVVITKTATDGTTAVANGTFAWDAAKMKRYCRMHYPTTFISNEKGKKKAGMLDREVIIVDEARTSVWHNMLHRSVPGYDVPIDINTRPFAVGERVPVDPKSLTVPDQEFFPEYMFRGNMPPVPVFLSFAMNAVQENASQISFRTPADGEFEVHIFGDSAGYFRMKRSGGMWLPDKLEGGSEMDWEWSQSDGLSVPKQLSVTEPDGTKTTYKIENVKLNHSIPLSRFNIDEMHFREGDYIADRITQRLTRYDGNRFFDVAIDGGKRKMALRLMVFTTIVLVLMFGLIKIVRGR